MPGDRDDNAHPPIHPTKALELHELNGNEQAVYELVTRHFLACCSADATGAGVTVDVAVGTERFQAKGLTIIERNYLEVH